MASRNTRTINKIKKSIKKVFESIKAFFKNIYKNIKALPSKVKLLIITWLVILIIIITLVSLTSNNTKTLKEYHTYESTINEAALKYADANSYYATRDKKLKVDIEELKDAKLITSNELPDNTCKGYSLVYFDDESLTYNSQTYINCHKYTSEGYYDYK